MIKLIFNQPRQANGANDAKYNAHQNQLETLLKDLDNEDVAIRERATLELEEGKPESIGLLKDVLSRTADLSPEVESRLEHIVRTLTNQELSISKERVRTILILSDLGHDTRAIRALETYAAGPSYSYETRLAQRFLREFR